MEDYDIVLVTVGAVSYFTSMLHGMLSFGDAIFFHLIWSIMVAAAPNIMHNTPLGENDLELVTLLLSSKAALMNPVLAWLTRKGANWSLIKIGAPIQSVTIVVGAAVLHFHSRSSWLQAALGLTFASLGLFFAFKIWRSTAQIKESQSGLETSQSVTVEASETAVFEVTSKHQMVLALTCVLTGVCAGISNIGGPPFIIYALAFELPKPMVRGTFPAITAAGNVTRFIVTLIAGGYAKETWMAHVVCLCGGFSGLLVGNELSRKMNQRLFSVVVCTLLILAAIVMARLNIIWIFTGVLFSAALITFVGCQDTKHQT